MKKLLALAIVETALFGLYAFSLSPEPSTCAEAENGSSVSLCGFVEETGEDSFVLNDGTGRVVVLGAKFEKGSAVIVKGSVFERSGTKFLNCESAELATEKNNSVTLKNLAESPERYLGTVIEVSGRVSRRSSNWFYLESEGYELLVLSSTPVEDRALITGSFFYDPKDMKYKMRALEVRYAL